MSAPVTIRSCHTLEEFQAGLDLQREIWGEDPLEVEPRTMFVVAAHTGGQVIGAFAGQELVGFVLAVAGVRNGRPYLHSHMAGIRKAFRNQGIGRRLKFFQREEALQRGIDRIEWTFDPLEVRNAHFNLNRLGAVCRQYLPDFYGVTTSPLHRGLRTDRLLAEWPLEEASVIARADAMAGAAGRDEENALTASDDADAVRVAVPGEVPGDISEATAIQDRLRAEFTGWFRQWYVATGITTGEQPAYLLVRRDKSPESAA